MSLKTCSLQTFVIHPPEEGEAGSTARSTTNYGSIGHCENDGFSIASPGNKGSPIICGYNTGQHSKTIRNTHIGIL